MDDKDEAAERDKGSDPDGRGADLGDKSSDPTGGTMADDPRIHPQIATATPAQMRLSVTLSLVAVAALVVMIAMPPMGLGAFVGRVAFAVAFALFVALIVLGIRVTKPQGALLALVILVTLGLGVLAGFSVVDTLADIPSLSQPEQTVLTEVSLDGTTSTTHLVGTDESGTEHSFAVDDATAAAADAAGHGTVRVAYLPHTSIALSVDFQE